MNCSEIRERLMDYLDGEIQDSPGQKTRTRMREHLGHCLECRREMLALEDLAVQARAMRTSVEPAADLWPDIENRIAASAGGGVPTSAWRSRWAFRLAAAAAFLVLALGFSLRWQPDESTHVAATQVVPENLPIDFGARANQARVEAGVLQVRRDLLGELDRRKEEMEPQTWREIETSLGELDRAIGEIFAALEEHPDDQTLNHLLATRYRQELSFLRRVARA